MSKRTPGTQLYAYAALALFAVAFLIVTISTGAGSKDYPDYITEWTRVLDGRNPWENRSPYNAYGPIFNILAALYWLHPLANKLLFALSYLIYLTWLTRVVAPSVGKPGSSRIMAIILLNPLPWIEIAYQGGFDGVVGIACVAAIHCRRHRRDTASGIWLAFGILLKYIPVVLLPLAMLDRRRFRSKLALACMGMLAGGIILSVLLWGKATFSPLIFAGSRSAVFSIYNVFHIAGVLSQRPWLSPGILALSTALVCFWCINAGVTLAQSSIMVLLATLLFYQVGYVQYQMVLFCLVSYWMVLEGRALEQNRSLIHLVAIYFGLVATMAIIADTQLVADSGLFAKRTLQISTSVLIFLKFLGGMALLAKFMIFPGRTRTQPHGSLAAEGYRL